jgi:SAM-dependent methyltransferase
MTTAEADIHLKNLGLVNPGSDMQALWSFGKSLIGDTEMQCLKDWITGAHGSAEEYILNKCEDDPFFRIIHSQKYDLFRQELIWLDSILPPDALVADLGCNTGHLTTIMAKIRPLSRFIGYDHLNKPLEKARRLSEAFKCERLTFEHHDVFGLQVNPKPDGLISLQGIGLALSSKRHADAVCRIADAQAFFAIVERFEDRNELKAVFENLEENGFICAHQSLLKVESLFCKGPMPGLLFTRGLPNERIPFDKISLS